MGSRDMATHKTSSSSGQKIKNFFFRNGSFANVHIGSHSIGNHSSNNNNSGSTSSNSSNSNNNNNNTNNISSNTANINNNSNGHQDARLDSSAFGGGSIGPVSQSRDKLRFRFFSTNSSGGSSSGRQRSQTIHSEGNPLDDVISPTALANPYFAHQGQPDLRHMTNPSSAPPSPPETPVITINGGGTGKENATSATKEELARKLRRVASAPNAHGFFTSGSTSSGGGGGSNGSNANIGSSIERPATAELGKDPLLINSASGLLALKDKSAIQAGVGAGALSPPGATTSTETTDLLGALPEPSAIPASFRRTYSSNSIKIRNVEVGPSSFDKIKLIGKGDVGKVYLVREKKSNRLYAMKSEWTENVMHGCCLLLLG